MAEVNPAGDVTYVSLQGSSGEDYAYGLGLTPDGVWLAGRFEGATLPYALLVPAKDLSGLLLPTAAAPVLTATAAATATAQPTVTPQLTETLANPADTPTSLAELSATLPPPEITQTNLPDISLTTPLPVDAPTGLADLSPTVPLPGKTEPASSQPGATDGVQVSKTSATPTAGQEASPPVEPDSGISISLWAGLVAGVVLVGALSAGILLLRRKIGRNKPEGGN